jgi:hypothetical protein
MKKILLILMILLSCVAFASDKLYVRALEDFSSKNPSEFFNVELLEDSYLDAKFLPEGGKLTCKLLDIKDAKRAKIDARIYFKLVSYEYKEQVYNFRKEFSLKYAKRVLNKKEIKKISPKKVAKTTASLVGGAVVEGFSYGVSLVDGIITNKEGNRIKSGVKQVYDDSFLSFVEYGDDVEIKICDVFYFIIKEIEN